MISYFYINKFIVLIINTIFLSSLVPIIYSLLKAIKKSTNFSFPPKANYPPKLLAESSPALECLLFV